MYQHHNSWCSSQNLMGLVLPMNQIWYINTIKSYSISILFHELANTGEIKILYVHCRIKINEQYVPSIIIISMFHFKLQSNFLLCPALAILYVSEKNQHCNYLILQGFQYFSSEFEFEFWWLTPLTAIFQLYHGDQF
jgi:hypothetical protein